MTVSDALLLVDVVDGRLVVVRVIRLLRLEIGHVVEPAAVCVCVCGGGRMDGRDGPV